MNTLRFAVIFLFAFAMFYSCEKANGATVLNVLQENFSSFYRVITPFTDLVAALNDTESHITVFAPSNQVANTTSWPANSSLLHEVLSYHISPNGTLTPAELTNQRTIPTLYTPPTLSYQQQVLLLSLMGTQITINGVSNISTTMNFTAENGVVYDISKALFPTTQSVYQLVAAESITQQLLNATKNMLNYTGVTFFAPTNQAYSTNPALVSWLLNPSGMSDATNVIENHIVTSVHYSYDLTNQTLTSSSSNSLEIMKPANWPVSPIVVNGNSNFVGSDQLATNGVVHEVSQVLLPPNFSFNTTKLLVGLGLTDFLTRVSQTPNAAEILSAGTLFVPRTINTTVTNTTLLYHAVAEQLMLTNINNGLVSSLLVLPTLGMPGNQQLTLTSSNNHTAATVNGQSVTYGGMSTTGTVVYLINNVLSLPPTVATVIENSANFSSLAAAVNHVYLWSNLTSESVLTVFAPTEVAFGALPNGTVGYLMLNNSQSIESLRLIVENHVVKAEQVLYTYAIQNGTTTLHPFSTNSSILVNKSGPSITVNGANVVIPDQVASNGVVHGINEVLIPESVQFSIVNILEGLGHYNTLIGYLNSTGLLGNLSVVTEGPFTIFAPDDEAFSNIADPSSLENNDTLLTRVLMTHLVRRNISELVINSSIGVETNQTIVVIGGDEIELVDSVTHQSQGTAMVLVRSEARNGYIYGIDTVLGVPLESGSSGLKTWQIALIVVGGVVVGLILLSLVVAIVYFVFLKPRTGYRKIN